MANKYWFIFLLTVSRTLDPILTKNRMSFFKTFPVYVNFTTWCSRAGSRSLQDEVPVYVKSYDGHLHSIRNFGNYLSNFCVHMNYKGDPPFELQILYTEEEFWCESNYSAYSISQIFVQYTVKPCHLYQIASLKKCTFGLKFWFCPGYLRWLLTQVFAVGGCKMSSIKKRKALGLENLSFRKFFVTQWCFTYYSSLQLVWI